MGIGKIIKIFSDPFFILTIFILSISSNSFAYQTKTKNLYGVPGLINMPVAGSFDDGEIVFSSSSFGPNLRNTLGFQALPNLYGVFRYSGIGDRDKLWYQKSGYTYWDRSFDLRLDVLKEKPLLPSITLGMQDILGTGQYSGEYLVASKSFLKKVEATVGFGFGRLGTRNRISAGFRERGGYTTGRGGEIRYKQLFGGDIGLFGGIIYKTPVDNLYLKAEYSSDNYEQDVKYSNTLPTNPITYGLNYEINDAVSISGYQTPNLDFGLQIDLSYNPLSDSAGDYYEKAPEPFYSHPIPFEKNDFSYWEKLKKNLKDQEIQLIAYSSNKNEVIIVIENYHYASYAQAIGRSLRILSKFIPSNKKNFKIILSEVGIPISQFTFNRDEISSIIDAPNAELLSRKIVAFETAPKIVSESIVESKYPNVSFSTSPYYRLHLFDPDNPVYYDLGIDASVYIQLKPGLILNGKIEKSLLSTFDNIYRGAKGKLPNVRTNIAKYLNELDTRITNLTVSSYFKYTKNLYGRISYGYLEEMYAGISNEILYAPTNSKVNFGAEINYVKPRDFDQLLSFRTVPGLSKINGHISAYWDMNYYNYLSQIDVGKYMAGDIGSTITLKRQFANGTTIGGFFTITDASAEEFGEGSFDKGFFLKLPINSIVPYQTRSSIYELVRPIQGDGGARVNVAGRLHDVVNGFSSSQIQNGWSRIWR